MKMPTENIKPLMQCPVCGKSFQSARVLVVAEDAERTTLHIGCDDCQATSLVFVSNGQWGVMSVGMLTDLVAEDAKTFFGKEPISSDQVLEVYQDLKVA
jgi:hypothetical protein